jgi:hypothetical protein
MLLDDFISVLREHIFILGVGVGLGIVSLRTYHLFFVS